MSGITKREEISRTKWKVYAVTGGYAWANDPNQPRKHIQVPIAHFNEYDRDKIQRDITEFYVNEWRETDSIGHVRRYSNCELVEQ